MNYQIYPLLIHIIWLLYIIEYHRTNNFINKIKQRMTNILLFYVTICV